MKRTAMILGLGLVAGGSLAWADTGADPLAPARAGKLECMGPNMAQKTCRAVAAYAFGADGSINSPSLLLIRAQPLTIMAVNSAVSIKAGALCGTAKAEDIDGSTILVDGRKLGDNDAAPLKAEIKAAYGPRLGKEICTVYVPSGDHFEAQSSIDGMPQPELTAQVIWVGPEDGFHVSP